MSGTLHIHLRAHRKARGFTQRKVAEALDVAHNTVSGWETGDRTLDLNDLEKLAKLYGVHPSALLLAPKDGPRADAMRRAADIASRLADEAAADWLRTGERIAPEPPPE